MFIAVEHPASSKLGICRNDDKTAEEYKVEGGTVLHLVLALRGMGPFHLLSYVLTRIKAADNFYNLYKVEASVITGSM